MSRFIKTTQGITVNVGENGLYPTEQKLVFGLAYKDGEPARYPNTTNPDEPKFLLTNEAYELYAYVTKDQVMSLGFKDNMWTILDLISAPDIKSIKASDLKPLAF